MEHVLKGMFGEKSVTKVVGLYSTQKEAEAAASRARSLPGLLPTQVRLLGPQDAKVSHSEFFGRSLEPEQRGIFKTLFRTHAIAGLAGAGLGLLLFVFFYSTGQPMVTSSPVPAFLAMVGFGTAFGLIAGGLLTLRPDHVQLISAVRTALANNRWALVLHPFNAAQVQAARDLLTASGAETLSTL